MRRWRAVREWWLVRLTVYAFGLGKLAGRIHERCHRPRHVEPVPLPGRAPQCSCPLTPEVQQGLLDGELYVIPSTQRRH